MLSTSKYTNEILKWSEKLPIIAPKFKESSLKQVQKIQGKTEDLIQQSRKRLVQELMNIRYYPDLSSNQEKLIRQKQKLANKILINFQKIAPAWISPDNMQDFKDLRSKYIDQFSNILETATYSFMYSDNDSSTAKIEDINKVTDKFSVEDLDNLIFLFDSSSAEYSKFDPFKDIHILILQALHNSKIKIEESPDIAALIQSQELYVKAEDGALSINEIKIDEKIKEKLPTDLKKLLSSIKSNRYEFTVENQFNWERKSDVKVHYQSNKVISHRNQANDIYNKFLNLNLSLFDNNTETNSGKDITQGLSKSRFIELRKTYLSLFKDILEAEASGFLFNETTNKPESLKNIAKISDELPIEDIDNLILLFKISSATYRPSSEYFDSIGTYSIILEALQSYKERVEDQSKVKYPYPHKLGELSLL